MILISILSALLLTPAPAAAPQDTYSVTDAKRDYSRLLLAEGMMLTCHMGTPSEKKADEDRLHPRIVAFETRIRGRFGEAIPATNRIKPDADSCNSRKRYTKELERALGQVEKGSAGLDAPAAAAPNPPKTGQ